MDDLQESDPKSPTFGTHTHSCFPKLHGKRWGGKAPPPFPVGFGEAGGTWTQKQCKCLPSGYIIFWLCGWVQQQTSRSGHRMHTGLKIGTDRRGRRPVGEIPNLENPQKLRELCICCIIPSPLLRTVSDSSKTYIPGSWPGRK